MKYYVIAGERSGDLHGGNLIRSIQRYDPRAVFRGFGGDDMQEAGMVLTRHYRDLEFMGLAALVTELRKIFKNLAVCKEDIRRFKPDVIVCIDYGGFNRRVAKFGREEGIPVHYYIPPKVWAWYQSRARDLKKNVTRMFVILPFEKDFYKKFGMEVDYVGNPVLDAVKAAQPAPNFRNELALDGTRPVVALLPGSRKSELRGIVPLMADLIRANPQWQFVVAAVSSLDDALYTPLRQSGVIFLKDRTYDLLQNADAAVVTSGTATLETALFQVPQAVVFRTGALEYFLARQVVKVKFISLVNLIAGREVVRELIQDLAVEEVVSAEVKRLLTDSQYRHGVKSGYREICNTLDVGSASDNAARLMTQYLKSGHL